MSSKYKYRMYSYLSYFIRDNYYTNSGRQTVASSSLDRNLLNLIKSKLVIGSIVQLCRSGRLMRRDLLSRFERSVVLQVNSNPGRPKRMAAHRSEDTGIKRAAPNHSVRLGPRHCSSSRLLLVECLKERLVWLKTRFFQILGHVILGLVVHRHLVMFAALFKQPEPAPAPIFVKI